MAIFNELEEIEDTSPLSSALKGSDSFKAPNLLDAARDVINREGEETDFTEVVKPYEGILDRRTAARVEEKEKQALLDSKYEQLTDYYRVDDGEPFDVAKEKELTDGLPTWMQQRALYDSQQDYEQALELEGSPVNNRTKSVLDHHLLEAEGNPFEAYEDRLNRDEHINATDRRMKLLPSFTDGVKGLDDNE